MNFFEAPERSSMHRLNFIKASIIVIIISMLSFYFCDKSDMTPSGTTGSTTQYLTADYLQKSKWRITQLNQNGADVTRKFGGYVLTFYSSGTVNALKEDSGTIKGEWATGSTNNKNELRLNFANDTTFAGLNKEWLVNELLVNRIRIRAVSRGHIGNDELVLEAI